MNFIYNCSVIDLHSSCLLYAFGTNINIKTDVLLITVKYYHTSHVYLRRLRLRLLGKFFCRLHTRLLILILL